MDVSVVRSAILTRRQLFRFAGEMLLSAAGLTLLSGCGVQSRLRSQVSTIPRVGYLGNDLGPGGNPYVGAFLQGLHELGLVDGRDLIIEYRFAQGKLERLPGLAEELVRLNVAVIVASRDQATHVVKRATGAIPIVTIGSSDPAGTGLVATLARPGGNVTGLTFVSPELTAKRLELLRLAAPQVVRVGILWNETSVDKVREVREAEAAAGELGIEIIPLTIRSANDLWTVFPVGTQRGMQALLVLTDVLTLAQREPIAFLAAQNKLPTVFEMKEFVEAGGLLSYGPNIFALYRRAADYVYKLLQGVRPGELPVERPTRFELAINLRTARSLGLVIPGSILIQADDVIE